jgi:hypothetical protein
LLNSHERLRWSIGPGRAVGPVQEPVDRLLIVVGIVEEDRQDSLEGVGLVFAKLLQSASEFDDIPCVEILWVTQIIW